MALRTYVRRLGGRKDLLLVAAVGLAGAWSLPAAVAEDAQSVQSSVMPSYLVKDLGDLGGRQTVALDMNDNGLIVGWSEVPAPGSERPRNILDVDGGPDAPRPYEAVWELLPHHAFVWDGRRIKDLGHLGAGWSEAHAVNNFGQIVGNSASVRGEPRAFYAYGGQMHDLNDLLFIGKGGSSLGGCQPRFRLLFEANDISDEGVIVGCGYVFNDPVVHGFIATPMHRSLPLAPRYLVSDLGRLEEGNCIAHRVNEIGQVVGISGIRGFIWEDAKMQPIETWSRPTLPVRLMSEARAVDDDGTAAGWSCGVLGDQAACAWYDGTRYDLVTLPGWISAANDLEGLETVVGWGAKDATARHQAMLWQYGRPFNLNVDAVLAPIPVYGPRTWMTLTEVTAIDHAGRLAANGLNRHGLTRAFVLYPSAP